MDPMDWVVQHPGDWGPGSEHDSEKSPEQIGVEECASCHHPIEAHTEPPVNPRMYGIDPDARSTCQWCGCPAPMTKQEALSLP